MEVRDWLISLSSENEDLKSEIDQILNHIHNDSFDDHNYNRELEKNIKDHVKATIEKKKDEN